MSDAKFRRLSDLELYTFKIYVLHSCFGMVLNVTSTLQQLLLSSIVCHLLSAEEQRLKMCLVEPIVFEVFL